MQLCDIDEANFSEPVSLEEYEEHVQLHMNRGGKKAFQQEFFAPS